MISEYDIAVIGAGVIGANAVYQAAQSMPNKRIALIDKDRVGFGCSGYAGAIISPINLSKEHQRKTKLSREWYESLQQNCTGLTRHLDTLVVFDQNSIKTVNSRLDTKKENSCVSPDWLTIPVNNQIVQSDSTLWGNVYAICQHLAHSHNNVDVYECLKVQSYVKKEQRWNLSLSDGRVLSAGQLVLAKGAWLTAHEQSVNLIINKKKIVAYEIDAPVCSTSPLVYFFNKGAFLLPLIDRQKWLFSITSQDWGCQPEGESCQITTQDREIAEGILSNYAPSLLQTLRGGRCHVDGYVTERHPQAVRTESGIIILGGGSGSGFRFAPWVGQQAQQLLFSS